MFKVLMVVFGALTISYCEPLPVTWLSHLSSFNIPDLRLDRNGNMIGKFGDTIKAFDGSSWNFRLKYPNFNTFGPNIPLEGPSGHWWIVNQTLDTVFLCEENSCAPVPNACMEGWRFNIAGFDAAGNSVIASTTGAYRVSPLGNCEIVELPSRQEGVGYMHYFRDTTGREYFSTMHNDLGIPSKTLLSIKGDQLDSIVFDNPIYAIRRTLSGGILVSARFIYKIDLEGKISDSITTISGSQLQASSIAIQDSKQNIWIANQAGGHMNFYHGLIRVSPQGEIAAFNASSGTFPIDVVRDIAEDTNGVLWVRGAKILAISNDNSLIPLHTLVTKQSVEDIGILLNYKYDILGRKVDAQKGFF